MHLEEIQLNTEVDSFQFEAFQSHDSPRGCVRYSSFTVTSTVTCWPYWKVKPNIGSFHTFNRTTSTTLNFLTRFSI